jgi:hypothetical protein
VGKYELYEPAPLQHEQRAEFGADLALVGWSLDPASTVQPGDTVRLSVVWQAQRALEADYTAFAHLVDESGQGWAGDDHPPYGGLYPTSAWGAGEMVRDTFSLTLPADTPPGLYDVQVGWYQPATQSRLPVAGGDSVRIAVLPVDWVAPPVAGWQAAPATFGQIIQLQGFGLEAADQALQLTLRWQPVTYLDRDYNIFVHLVAPVGGRQAIAQGDAPPLDGRWPTSLWLPGVPLNDPHTVPLPPDLASGVYELWIGLYDPASGQRLPLADGSDALRLAEIPLP